MSAIGIQLNSPNSGYQPIPDASTHKSAGMDSLELDVEDPERSIARQEQNGFRRVATVLGSFLVVCSLMWFSAFETVNLLMPPIQVFQTSNQLSQDRLSELGSFDMKKRGFDVGLLSFGNMQCNKLLKVIGTVQGYECNPPSTEADDGAALVSIDRTSKQQRIIGFGGAFTEAAANNFQRLPKQVQEQVLSLYFSDDEIGESVQVADVPTGLEGASKDASPDGDSSSHRAADTEQEPGQDQQQTLEKQEGQRPMKGIGYTLGRLPINSCDFSVESYSFDGISGDYDLNYFDTDLTHDSVNMIPFMQKAMSSSENRLRLLASPWSPPQWMKNPVDGVQSMNGSASPQGLIDDHATKTVWANYISKWIDSYALQGLRIWGVTPQNEPEFDAPWEACMWSETGERDWVAQYLGPILKRNHAGLKILGYDHNKDHLLNWAKVLYDDSDKNSLSSTEWLDGIAFHWYAGSASDRTADGTYGYNNVNATHHLQPNKILLASEGCSCPGVRLGDWKRAEIHAHDVIFDLMNYAQGWIDWNLLVDSTGGYNHLGNECDAPIVTNADFTNIHVQPKFFYMGHISRFVLPNSNRIFSTITGNYHYDTSIDANVHKGYELSAWGCERSTRQMWKFSDEGYLELRTEVIDQEATYHRDSEILAEKMQNNPETKTADSNERRKDYSPIRVRLCIGPGDATRPFLKLVQCTGAGDETKAHRTSIQKELGQHVAEEDSRPLHIRFSPFDEKKHELLHGQLVDKATSMCITLADGVKENGALLVLQKCLSSTKRDQGDLEAQAWVYDHRNGELTALGRDSSSKKTSNSRNRHELCITAGWPMLTGVAFEVPPRRLSAKEIEEIEERSKGPEADIAGSSKTKKHRNSGPTDEERVEAELLGEVSSRKIALVLLNEADAGTQVVLQDSKQGSVWFGISGRSMQTVLYD